MRGNLYWYDYSSTEGMIVGVRVGVSLSFLGIGDGIGSLGIGEGSAVGFDV